MRQLLLTTLLLLSLAAHAQLSLDNDFQPGSYVLKSSPHSPVVGMLKLNGTERLVVQKFRSKNLKLTPDDVTTFRLGTHKYVVATDFEVDKGLITSTVDKAFVEQVDSGRVVLLHYPFVVGGAPMMGSGGMMMGGMASYRDLYLLLIDGVLTPIQVNASNGGRKFRDALLPFLTSRPDLVNLLEGKHVSADDMPAIVHALNTGKAFRALDLGPK